jgi:adenylate cyclase, class 2
MSFEVELKFHAGDHDRLRARLAALGASPASTYSQEDVYLNHPARDFAQTNEAFRLRRTGQDNSVTYKGPRRGGPTKTREEIEIPFAAGSDAAVQLSSLFELLGFQRVAAVRKSRTGYELTEQGHKMQIALDEVEGLGRFAEIETIAAKEGDVPAAQQAVLALAERLGLTEVEPRSYLRMILEMRQGAGGIAGRSGGGA